MGILSKNSLMSLGAALLLAPMLIGGCSKAGVAQLEGRIDQLESQEQIRSILLDFAAVVDSSEPALLSELAPKIHRDFEMVVIDFAGGEHRFAGIDELIEGYGPIMASAQANLAASAIAVELEGERATATYKFINSVKPPPELDLDIDFDEKLLLFAANTATFVREGGDWKLKTIELDHSLAYPGSLAALDD
jgi:hypothetical protein